MADTVPEIGPLDLTDERLVRAFAQIHQAAEAASTDYPVPFQQEELRAFLAERNGSEHWHGFIGKDQAGAPMVAGILMLPQADNLDKADISVWVAPEHRRRGYGSAMAATLVEKAGREARTTLTAHVTFPTGADEHHPDRAFAAKLGFALSNSELHRVLDLPVPQDLLDRLSGAAAPKHTDYRLVEYIDDGIPDEVLPSYLDLMNALMVDAPTGDVEYETGGLTPELFHTESELNRSQGRTLYRTVALDADGRAAAHSTLCVPGKDPGKVFQFGTLVRREHRGHRLGLAVKVRNVATVQREHPDRRLVHTWNAASNTHMIAVNEAMGFRVVDESAEYVRRLGG